MDTKTNTESPSYYDNLEKKSVIELITDINKEDQKVAKIVKAALPQIEKLITAALKQMKAGGRLFYIGAGTSGRLGVVDASECPPTFGVSDDLVIGIIAGGEQALRSAVENAEDDMIQAWKDLQKFSINSNDSVIGIAASGRTPYVIGGLDICNKNKITTGCIVCNVNTPIGKVASFPVECVVGPEFVTGSTRMKSGTAQKLI